MVRVRMLQKITGTRQGKHWPEPGEETDVEELTTRMLTRQKMAVRVQQPEKQPEPPARSDLKAAWIEHAAARGLSRVEASKFTKDELIARFDEE